MAITIQLGISLDRSPCNGYLTDMPRTSDAKDRFIRTAARLVAKNGYHGTGLTELIELSGAPKGSFYHHFPGGKEELAAAVVAYAANRVGATIDHCFQRVSDFGEGVEELCEVIAGYFEESSWREGCPLAGIAINTVPESALLHAALRQGFGQWVNALAGHGRRFGLAPEIAQQKAERLAIGLEGAWLVARIRQDSTAFKHVPKMLAGI